MEERVSEKDRIQKVKRNLLLSVLRRGGAIGGLEGETLKSFRSSSASILTVLNCIIAITMCCFYRDWFKT